MEYAIEKSQIDFTYFDTRKQIIQNLYKLLNDSKISLIKLEEEKANGKEKDDSYPSFGMREGNKRSKISYKNTFIK